MCKDMEDEMLDLAVLDGNARPPMLAELSLLHKRQAQMIAQGKTPSAVAGELGTTERRVNNLMKSPAFKHLIEIYKKDE